MKKWLLLTLMTLSLTGCGTLMTLDIPIPYSGIQADMEVFGPCSGPGCLGLIIVRPVAIIDFPFSFVGDTLMLPVKGIQNLVQD
ncbi:YceK/YidQ family lipoprotein [Aggregatibacter actinomycetemcomitans]|uniref:YceK/YidQ family lipoprotein n=1 Tax=Aggregatibacter actinomycetemcomitans TaxID=714 RepID=UPI00197BE2BF|nr:YceK/YidQ family lipoprotein [Aggregatibacter actinomycetemcomitans]MBN6074495.1 YceK/YidQ family lipoprotein [Aggregatibacter actinomycetemcomitans]